MRTFVTSDTHFGHINIIRYCNRPFADVAKMNASLIERWNARVGNTDTVYFLGDFAMGPGVDAAFVCRTMYSLNGIKCIVLGNHDMKSKYGPGLKVMLESSTKYGYSIMDDQIIERQIDGKTFIMSHFPLEEWENKHHGSIHLHGHTHGGSQHHDSRKIANRYDIGVDVYGGPVEVTGDLRYLNDPKGWS